MGRLALACALALALPASASAAAPSLTGPASIAEGAGKATYTLSCGDTPNPVPVLPAIPNVGTLTVTVADGPAPAATKDADYGAPSTETVNCTPATPQHTFEVPITSDALDEPNERFTVTVSGPLGTGEFSQSVTTTITDDDVPTAAIGGIVRIVEGDSGTSTASLAVTLSQTPVEAATIRYATENSSATAGSDYTATDAQLVIAAGQTSGTISIPVVGDTVPEGVEGFLVNLVSADKALIDPTKKQGVVAIFDNDKEAVPTVSLGRGVGVVEGNSGVVNALFTVTLSSRSSQRVEVKWSTASGTADLADYVRGAGTLVFAPGETTKTISVDVQGDVRDERAETFTVSLSSPTGATLGNPKSAPGVIADDDGPKVAITRPVMRPKAMRVALKCPATAENCAGSLAAVSGKLKLGRATFALASGESKTVKLRLSRKARRALRKRSRRVKLTATATDASGGTFAASRTFRLRLR